MDINVVRQNRWIALIVGAFLVSLSIISLLVLNNNASGQEDKRILTDWRTLSVGSALATGDGGTTTAGTPLVRNVPKTIGSEYQHWNIAKQMQLVMPVPFIKTEAFFPVKPVHHQFFAELPKDRIEKIKIRTSIKPKNITDKAVSQSQFQNLTPPTTLFFTRTKLLTQDQKSQATWTYALSSKELLLLQKIVMAEAEGEPYEGKVAVANVVLNRLRSANFPDSITDVIYQKYQFSPVANGRLDRVKPSEETIKAVNAAITGHKAVSDNTYFFLSLKLAQDLTVHHNQTFVKKIGNHTFYK